MPRKELNKATLSWVPGITRMKCEAGKTLISKKASIQLSPCLILRYKQVTKTFEKSLQHEREKNMRK